MPAQKLDSKRIASQVLLYMGSGWLFVEISVFVIGKYDLDRVLAIKIFEFDSEVREVIMKDIGLW